MKTHFPRHPDPIQDRACVEASLDAIRESLELLWRVSRRNAATAPPPAWGPIRVGSRCEPVAVRRTGDGIAGTKAKLECSAQRKG